MKDSDDIHALIAGIGSKARAAAAELAFATPEAQGRGADRRRPMRSRRSARRSSTPMRSKIDFGAQKGLSPAMMDRLRLDERRVQAIADGLRAVAAQPDPVGQVIAEWDMPSGLHIAPGPHAAGGDRGDL